MNAFNRVKIMHVRLCVVCAFVLLASSHCPAVFAGWFGPSNTYECIEKYRQKTYYIPGFRVVQKACLVFYEGDRKYKRAAECVLDDAAGLSSHPASLALINKCTTKYEAPQIYRYFVNALEDE